MVNFYINGHEYEYEIYNVYRIFDFSGEMKFHYDGEVYEPECVNITNHIECKEKEVVSCTKLYYGEKLITSNSISSDSIVLEKNDELKLKKTIVKKSVYTALSEYFSYKAKYGILTGVRPIKIVFSAIEHGYTLDEACDILKNTYLVDDEKVSLLRDIYKLESKYVDKNINRNNYNLYIGIPFCPSKCIYCSFTSFVNYKEKQLDDYINKLVIDIEKTINCAMKKGLKLNTIYIGGGTPSVLNCNQINRIFDVLKKYYDLSTIKEITFEAGRPDTIDKDKLSCLKINYVNRISINPQTMNDKTLQAISRKHSIKDFIEKYNLARSFGFESINMDLILGLPGEDEKDVAYTIENIVKLRPDNITVHALAYKKNSALTRSSSHITDESELLMKMFEETKACCENNQYIPYYMYRQKSIKGNLENIGYTVHGKESIYNIIIIEEAETILACGAGSTSKILMGNNRHERLSNFKSLHEYMTRLDELIDKKNKLIEESVN